MMRNIPSKAALVGFSLLFLSLSSVHAATVSMMVIESGPSKKNGAEIAALWENAMMDVFFDAGHIVSNAPALKAELPENEDFPESARTSFEDASRGGADFFIIVQLKAMEVAFRVYAIHPYRLLYTGQYTEPTNLSLKEEFSNAKKATQMIIPYLRGR
jgi:hypothetical protein